VSVKDCIVLAPMASHEFCTDHMSSFMRPRVKTSSREQRPDFDLVGTCEWLSHVSLRESSVWRVGQVLSPAGCISIRVIVILSVMSGSLSVVVIS
jgi:hypothetical protein